MYSSHLTDHKAQQRRNRTAASKGNFRRNAEVRKELEVKQEKQRKVDEVDCAVRIHGSLLPNNDVALFFSRHELLLNSRAFIEIPHFFSITQKCLVGLLAD